MKLLMQVSPAFHYITLSTLVLLSILFLKTLKMHSSFNMRDLVSHPYRTRGKIVILCVVVFMFLDYRQEGKGI
jgi:hypothetical protein